MPIRFDRSPLRPKPEQPKRPERSGRPAEPAPDNAALAQEKTELHERFSQTLQGNFDLFPPAPRPWKTELPGITGISIIPSGDGSAPPNQLFVYAHYERDGKPRRADFTLLEDGMLMGAIPSALRGSLRREDIYREVMNIVEAIGIAEFRRYTTDVSILPGDAPEPTGTGEEEWKGINTQLDPRREAFIRAQEGARFTFGSSGHLGATPVQVYVFDRFLYVASARFDLADFIFDLDTPIASADLEGMPRPNDLASFTDWLKGRPWFPLLSQGRTAAREAIKDGRIRGEVLRHRGSWEPMFQEAIDKRKRMP